MIENLAISFIIIVALYYLIITLKRSLSEKSHGCTACSLTKKDFDCKGLCGKIKPKDKK